jgi:hypothetical protein
MLIVDEEAAVPLQAVLPLPVFCTLPVHFFLKLDASRAVTAHSMHHWNA